MSGWHIQHNEQAKGPYSDDQLKVLCETGVVNASTLTWKSDYSSWKPLAETDFIYKAAVPPPPLRQAMRPAPYTETGQPGESLSLWDYYIRAIGDNYVN